MRAIPKIFHNFSIDKIKELIYNLERNHELFCEFLMKREKDLGE